MSTRWHKDAAAMVALVLALAALTIAFGERIGINGGQGWDGISYTTWAEAFWQRVIARGLTVYHSQRVLPSAVVHYGLRLAGLPPDARHVIAGFAVLNTAMLALAALLWAHLGRVMAWRRATLWVGFVALFGGFANARHALYYPTLTDPTAFTLGMAMLWGYLARRPWVVWLTAALGIVTWPALPPVAMLMLVLPRPDVPLAPAARPSRRWRAAVAALGAGLGALGFLWIARHYLQHPVPGVGDEKFAQWVRRDLLFVTAPALAAMLGVGGFVLAVEPRLWNVRAYVRQLAAQRTALAAASVAVLLVARSRWLAEVGTHGPGPTGAQFACELTLSAIRGPLWGLVHHVVYFGPIILVACLCWRRLAQAAAAWGPAASVGLAMTLAFAAGSNSRQWNHLLPLLVAVTAAATNERWTARRALAFALIALPWSKLWLAIGYDRHVHWWQFPNQRYFMNQGPYATDASYAIHLAAAALTAALLAFLVRRAARADDGSLGAPAPIADP